MTNRKFPISILLILLCLFVPGVALAEDVLSPGDTAWMLTATGLVLLMTPGLAFFYGGMVHPKNIISTMMQSYIAMGIVSIIWVVLGFSIGFEGCRALVRWSVFQRRETVTVLIYAQRIAASYIGQFIREAHAVVAKS